MDYGGAGAAREMVFARGGWAPAGFCGTQVTVDFPSASPPVQIIFRKNYNLMHLFHFLNPGVALVSFFTWH
jgi:hypothetical protein